MPMAIKLKTSGRMAALVTGWTLAAVSCAPVNAPGRAPSAAAPSSVSAEDAELDRVAAIHGAPGPWAVAGYRMGRYALGKLGLAAGTVARWVLFQQPVKEACSTPTRLPF